MEERIQQLEQELMQLKEFLNQFRAVTVDLRIKGTVRPVIIFASDPTPNPEPFSIVA